jgi:hypothetical protein
VSSSGPGCSPARLAPERLLAHHPAHTHDRNDGDFYPMKLIVLSAGRIVIVD